MDTNLHSDREFSAKRIAQLLFTVILLFLIARNAETQNDLRRDTLGQIEQKRDITSSVSQTTEEFYRTIKNSAYKFSFRLPTKNQPTLTEDVLHGEVYALVYQLHEQNSTTQESLLLQVYYLKNQLICNELQKCVEMVIKSVPSNEVQPSIVMSETISKGEIPYRAHIIVSYSYQGVKKLRSFLISARERTGYVLTTDYPEKRGKELRELVYVTARTFEGEGLTEQEFIAAQATFSPRPRAHYNEFITNSAFILFGVIGLLFFGIYKYRSHMRQKNSLL